MFCRALDLALFYTTYFRGDESCILADEQNADFFDSVLLRGLGKMSVQGCRELQKSGDVHFSADECMRKQ